MLDLDCGRFVRGTSSATATAFGCAQGELARSRDRLHETAAAVAAKCASSAYDLAAELASEHDEEAASKREGADARPST
eukprot:scaffold274764_cov30-Tisochrysis_lutea.AAC.2